MVKVIQLLLSAVVFSATFTSQTVAENQLRILTMGDSLLAAHRVSNRAISNTFQRALGAYVADHSVIGARMIYRLPLTGSIGFSIPKQYRSGDWDWIVLNGGGNDLWLGCGCIRCSRKMNKLISQDGRVGTIPKLVSKLRRTGARVLYVGYLRSPGVGSPIEHCKDEGNELERRLSSLAEKDDGLFFVSLADLVPKGDRSYHAIDMIHPSIKASREIGLRIARVIAQ